MADSVAVIHTACFTASGPQSITKAGFGTVKGAIAVVSKGTVNGTVVNHSMIGVGFTDGTRTRNLCILDRDALGTTDNYRRGDRTNLVTSLLDTAGTLDGSATVTLITDGIQLTWTDYPPVAYLLTVYLFGGTGVTNCYVNDLGNPGGLNVAATVTPGFLADIVFLLTLGGSSYGGTVNAAAIMTLGVCTRDGTTGLQTSPIPTQRCIGISCSDAIASSSTIQSCFQEDSAAFAVQSGTGSDRLEVNTFTSTTFDIITRIANITGGIDVAYMAIQLSGLTAKLVTYDTKTSSGAHAITGAGSTPQFGMILAGAQATVGATGTGPDCEGFGVGGFTTSGKGAHSIASDDNQTPSNTESEADAKAINLRNSAADFIVADFTSFNSNGADLNYTTFNGTARKTAVLFISAPAGAGAAVKPMDGPFAGPLGGEL